MRLELKLHDFVGFVSSGYYHTFSTGLENIEYLQRKNSADAQVECYENFHGGFDFGNVKFIFQIKNMVRIDGELRYMIP